MTELSPGYQMVASILTHGFDQSILRSGRLTDLMNAGELDLYEKLVGHFTKYHALPQADTIWPEEIPVPTGLEPPAYYLDQLRSRQVEKTLRDSVEEASAFMAGSEKNPLKAMGIIRQGIFDVSTVLSDGTIFDFRGAANYFANKLKQPSVPGLKLGWPTLDGTTIGGGDVISFVGRPAAGKTWMLLYIALSIWVQNKLPVLFVSMEMRPEILLARLSAMHTSTPVEKVNHFTEYTMTHEEIATFHEKLQALESVTEAFQIVEGTHAPTIDAIAVLAQMSGAGAVFIDGAYLLRHPAKNLDRYRRVAENMDLIKQRLSSDLDIPVFASWQFTKEGGKQIKKGKTPGLEEIGYSDAIAQHSSLVLGMMQEESPETIQTREISVLKGRHGEVGEFKVRWDFDNMDFSEVDDTPPEIYT